MSRWTRLLLAAGVLGGTIYWANCGFTGTCSPPGDFFEGCFEGPTTAPAGGRVRVILYPVDPANYCPRLDGCMQYRVGLGETVLAALSGHVRSEPTNESDLIGAVPGTTSSFNVLAARQPPGESAAMTMDLWDEGGAPFTSALGLARCAAPVTCADLGLRMPFGPETP